ncbi:MAG: hypothetical protein ACU84Q_00350 [Gammaproteobacteria bacterium]
MSETAFRLLLFASFGGAAVTIYAWIGQFLLSSNGSFESQVFKQQPAAFYLYALTAAASLLAGPRALRVASKENRLSRSFLVICVLVAWSGVYLSATIGSGGLGGVTMKFYWWGLALVWTFLLFGSVVLERTRKPLAARDWAVYAYALTWLPPIVFIIFPVWKRIANMSADEAMITSVTLPFAGAFVLAHWIILEFLEKPN